MKNRLRRKWICCFNCILLKLNNVYPYIKRENINLTDWPCHAWLQKRVWPTNKATLGVCYWLLCTNLSDGNLGGNSVYQRWTICPLKSESVLKCIFLGSGDPNFKISILGALHGGNLWDTDLANSTETQSLRKNGCRQKCLDESLITITLTNISIFLFNRSSSISASG